MFRCHRACALGILVVALGAFACKGKALPRKTMSKPLDTRIITKMPANQTGGRAVVMLHGWGAPGDDLVPLAMHMLEPDMRFFVPAAPLPHPGGGRAWWHLDRGRTPHADGTETSLPGDVPDELRDARAAVQALLDLPAETRARLTRSLDLSTLAPAGATP